MRKRRTEPEAQSASKNNECVDIHPGNVRFAWDAARRELTVRIDCSAAAAKAALASSSGKSRILATSTGFAPVIVQPADLAGLRLSLTATLPAQE